MQILDKQIDRICIIDDDEDTRNSLEERVQDSGFEPFMQDKKVKDVEAFLNQYLTPRDAIISDHQLRIKNYFPMNGAEVVSKCYEKHIPSILVTRYEANISEIRRFRKFIPVILNPSDFETAALIDGLMTCVNEFKGNFQPDRRMHRNQVRVDAKDDSHIYINIPGWDTNEIISIAKEEVPPEIWEVSESDRILHVKVNVGCESINELFFDQWEPK